VLFSGEPIEWRLALISQIVTALVLIWYLVQGIQSFRAARR
jgi:hypothetical protein